MASDGEADAVAALGALTALLGPNVALCLHEDGSAPGSPSHDSHACCVDCALCQHGPHSAAVLPSSHAVPAPLAGASRPLAIPSDPGSARPRRAAFAQPRAPPISA
jgi:hypothetical protein